MRSPEAFAIAATREARTWLSLIHSTPSAVIPIDLEGWQRSLDEVDIQRIPSMMSDLCVLVAEAADQRDFVTIRDAANRVVSQVQPITDDLWCLSAFIPAGVLNVAALRASLCEAVERMLSTLEGNATLSPDTIESIERAVERLGVYPGIGAVDPWEEAFGLTRASLFDGQGSFSGTRFLAAFHGDYPRLEQESLKLFSPLSGKRLPVTKIGSYSHGLIDSPYPLLTLLVARGVQHVVSRSFARDPEGTAEALSELLLRVDRSYSNHLGIMQVIELMSSRESRSERALLTLDLYRKMLEGQLRPWAWTLTRLLGRGGARIPEVSSLRDQLVATQNRLARKAADCILPVVRNAAAHEDYSWDPKKDSLVVGDINVSVDELTIQTERAYAFMCGAEIGWAFARLEIAELADRVDRSMASMTSAILKSTSAIDFYGTNGLKVARWNYEEGCLSVSLDDLKNQQVNPCIQATMWASQSLPEAQRFKISLATGSQKTIIDIDRSALDSLLPLWLPARRWFSSMPTSVFVPVLAVARLSTESASDTANAAIWFALNDAMHAYDLAHELQSQPVNQRLLGLSRSLALAAEALAITATLIPTEISLLQGHGFQTLQAAADWTASRARGICNYKFEDFERAISTIRTSLPVPSILPALDPTPIA